VEDRSPPALALIDRAEFVKAQRSMKLSQNRKAARIEIMIRLPQISALLSATI
jgi:hypothetical protein